MLIDELVGLVERYVPDQSVRERIVEEYKRYGPLILVYYIVKGVKCARASERHHFNLSDVIGEYVMRILQEQLDGSYRQNVRRGVDINSPSNEDVDVILVGLPDSQRG